jgi:hypothetical protein
MPKEQSANTRGKKQRRARNRSVPKSSQVKIGQTKTGTKLEKSDVRVATSTEMKVSLSNQLKTITINKIINDSSLYWFCAGYISRALERGYQASASDTFNAYYALQYMENLVLSYILSQQVPSTQLPYWLLCVCHAISPKSAPFESGKVNYQFTWGASQPIVPTVNNGIGYLAYGYQYSLGIPTATLLNGFPTVTTSGFAYTDAKGSSAFQEICKFMETNASTQEIKRVSRIVPSSTPTPFQTEVSAFAVMKLAEGNGSSGDGGGIYGQTQLEVPILHPILSLFGCGSDTLLVSNPFRNFNWSTPVTGDPTMLSALASTNLSIRQLSMKRNPRVKQVDFLEFGDVLARWATKIIQAYFNDVAEQLTLTQAQEATCPLTLQEMLLCLRSVMMGAFKESQAAVQGLYPFVPASSSDNQFVPFVCGVNCCPLLTSDISLPSLFVENIRALVARQVHYGGSPQNVRWYLPSLGQYALDQLSASDYQVTYKDSTGAVTTMNVFASGALWEKEVRTKEGQILRTTVVETPISMVDGSSGSSLCYINDPTRLKDLSAMWNTWFATSGVSSYSMKACTFGTESGINVLASIGMTRLWVNTPPSVHSASSGRVDHKGSSDFKVKHQSLDLKEHFCDLRMKGKFITLTSGPYAGRNAIVDISQGEVLAAPYEQILQVWILPTNHDEVILNTPDSLLLQRYQFMFGESYSVPRVGANTGTTVVAIHDVYASKMTKGKLAEKTDTGEFLDEMAKRGRGGILSGLVASLVGSAVPGLSGVAASIASSLPI